MAELIILLVIGVGLCRRRGQPWEWSRARLDEALRSGAGRGERLAGRALRSLPGVLGQCVSDVRSLVDDMLGILDPKARTRIAKQTRSLLAGAPERARRLAGPAAGAPLVARGRATASIAAGSGEAGAAAFARLQRRYLDGAISLEEYVTESRRLAPPARPG